MKVSEFVPDRRVHAFGDHGQVVRYEKAGKWFFEPKDGKRWKLTLTQAVEEAIWLWYHDNGSVNIGKPGGGSFDRALAAKLGEKMKHV